MTVPFSWKEAAAPSDTICFDIYVLSEDIFNADPEADAIGKPPSLDTLAKVLPFFSLGHAEAGRQLWGPTMWCFSSRSGDVASMLPAAVAPGPCSDLLC